MNHFRVQVRAAQSEGRRNRRRQERAERVRQVSWSPQNLMILSLSCSLVNFEDTLALSIQFCAQIRAAETEEERERRHQEQARRQRQVSWLVHHEIHHDTSVHVKCPLSPTDVDLD